MTINMKPETTHAFILIRLWRKLKASRPICKYCNKPAWAPPHGTCVSRKLREIEADAEKRKLVEAVRAVAREMQETLDPVTAALSELNKDGEQWHLRRAEAQKSDGRKCWRLENKEGHLRAEIHIGGDPERNIYSDCADPSLQSLQSLAQILWAKNKEQKSNE